MNKLVFTKLTVIGVTIGMCMTFGANFAYLFFQLDENFVFATAFMGINIVTASLFLYVIGVALGWSDKKEA